MDFEDFEQLVLKVVFETDLPLTAGHLAYLGRISVRSAEKKLGAGQIALSEDPAILHSAGIVLVTVKSADSADVADQIARHAPEDAVIVSL